MNLKQLEYFVAIAEERQITAAARRLNISQPPLSYELRQLESELGVTLVVRGPRQARLTEAGQLLYQRATKILAMTAAARREVESVGSGMTGALSLGVCPDCAGLAPRSLIRVTDTGDQFIKVVDCRGLDSRPAVVWRADRLLSPLAERAVALLGELS